MSEVKKVLFIINKFAGGGFHTQHENTIVNTCKKYTVEFTLSYTKGPDHAITLSREASKTDIDMVVAVGGDGTLNEVAQGLVNTKIPLGIIPRGSGNGLARHLGIPLDIVGALENLFFGKKFCIDTFTLNNRLSLNVSGIGFDGRIANLFGGKTKRGLTGYAKLTLHEFFRFKEFQAEISFDGNTITRKAFIIAIANSSQYGNNACIAPAASVADGILHLNILKKIPPYRLDFVYAIFSKKIDRTNVAELVAVKNVRIQTLLPVAYHIDGEPCGTETSFEIAITPSSLFVVIPAENMV
jgi:diacylglycerol kinase (ATP)